jgi:hypothetical protein
MIPTLSGITSLMTDGTYWRGAPGVQFGEMTKGELRALPFQRQHTKAGLISDEEVPESILSGIGDVDDLEASTQRGNNEMDFYEEVGCIGFF